MHKHFNKFFWISALLVFVIVCLRAYFIPFSHDEAATFFFYVQSDNFLPYFAHVYTNNHVLNSALSNLCYHLAGSHRFVLRIPNMLAFILLCIGIYRHFKYFKSIYPKIILLTFFVFTFGFLDFFELCRGYGLSLGLMLLGLSFLVDYFDKRQLKSLVYFSICWQFALAANLILVVVLSVMLCYILVFQYKYKLLFAAKNLMLQIINLAILAFWIKFSFFYRSKGVLDYGVGTGYWEVSFKTLIYILFGVDELWFQILVVSVFAIIMAFLIYDLFKNSFYFKDLFTPQLFYPFAFILIIWAFYLQKKVLNVNYPEDRTGLFFYLFFVISLALVIDVLPALISKSTAAIVLSSSIIYFALHLNFSHFSTWFYHTMPKSIYETLLKEFEKEKKLFTVGGHRVREMNYAFANYRGNAMLNGMDNSEEMQMNCDFYYAQKREKPYYDFFYDEIAYDHTWDRVLLKRREKIGHNIFYSNYDKISVQGNAEFYDFKRLPDTSFKSHNPIEIEAELHFENVPKPFNAFFVMSMQNSRGETVYYKRAPLNWLADDLNGQVKYIKLTTGNLPDTLSNFVVHIWNIDKKEMKVTLNHLKIYQLTGAGVDFKIPATFYPLIEKITRKPLL
jgi:hypothetical protein